MSPIAFIGPDHNLHKLSAELQASIVAAQNSAFEHEFPNAYALMSKALGDLKLAVPIPQEMAQRPASTLSDQAFPALIAGTRALLQSGEVADQSLRVLSEGLATRIQLLRAFENPDAAVRNVRDKVAAVIRDFPSKGKHLEMGRNKGDVLDPFILAANEILLWEGSFEDAIGATVSHKALMIIEGLMGHLHEEVIGMMRGNVRVPEPRGQDQEAIDFEYNPFPGADVMQPPMSAGDKPKFHQIKSKTGSAKGGDGKRLGDQLARLRDLYEGEIYYHALVGNTLVGHRSKAGVEKAAPDVIVQVGDASFRTLTGSSIGPHLLLRLYQEAFREAASVTGFSIPSVLEEIVEYFRAESEAHGESFLETVLENATQGPEEVLDNRLFNDRRAKNRNRPLL